MPLRSPPLRSTSRLLPLILDPQVSGLWILLAGTVAAAVLIFLGGQLALCGARRLAKTKTYQQSISRLHTVRGSLPRRSSFTHRNAADANGEANSGAAGSRAEAGLADAPAPADPRALAAAVADLAAQLQALAAQAAAANSGDKEHSK